MNIDTKTFLTATIANYCPAFHVLDHAMHQLHQLLVDLKACTLPTRDDPKVLIVALQLCPETFLRDILCTIQKI